MTTENITTKEDVFAKIALVATDETAKHFQALETKFEAKFKSSNDESINKAILEATNEFQKQLNDKDASISDLKEKYTNLDAIMQAAESRGLKEKSLNGEQSRGSFSKELGFDILSAHVEDEIELAKEFTARKEELEAYHEHTSSLYNTKSDSYNKAATAFKSKFSNSSLFSAASDVLKGNDLEYARKIMNSPAMNFSLVGGGSYYDPEILRDFKTCLDEPDNLLGEFAFRSVRKRDYKYAPDFLEYQEAVFVNDDTCEMPNGNNLVLAPEVTRRVKLMGSKFCMHRHQIEDSTLDIAGRVRRGISQQMINGMNAHIMFGNGANVDNWLDKIEKTQLTTGAVPAPAFITWQALVAAYDALTIQNKSNVKIYTTRLGRTQLSAMADTSTNPSRAVQFVNGQLEVQGIPVRTTNRSFHTSGYGNSVGGLQPMKANYIVGDLKQVATLIMHTSPTVTRYTGSNGSFCDVFVGHAEWDFVMNCPNAAIKLISP
jgi:hypothetical protein